MGSQGNGNDSSSGNGNGGNSLNGRLPEPTRRYLSAEEAVANLPGDVSSILKEKILGKLVGQRPVYGFGR